MSNYEFWNELGKIFNAVVAYQEKSIEFNKRFINPWIRIGNVFDKQDQYREAVRSYQHAIEIDPSNAENWLELGNAHFAHQAYEDAVEAFQKAIELDPNQGWPYSNLAFIYAMQGRYVEAKDLYEKSIPLLKEDREKAISWNRLGNLHRKLNEYELAIHAFQKADELDHENGGFKDELDEVFKQSQPRKEGGVAQADSIPTSIQLIVEQNQKEEEAPHAFSDMQPEPSPAVEIVEADAGMAKPPEMPEGAYNDETPSQPPSMELQTQIEDAPAMQANTDWMDQVELAPVVAEESPAEAMETDQTIAVESMALEEQPANEAAVVDESLNVAMALEAADPSAEAPALNAMGTEYEIETAPAIAEETPFEAPEQDGGIPANAQEENLQPDINEPTAVETAEEPAMEIMAEGIPSREIPAQEAVTFEIQPEVPAEESPIEVESVESAETRFEVMMEAAASSDADAPALEIAGKSLGESDGEAQGLNRFYEEFLVDDARERVSIAPKTEPPQAALSEASVESPRAPVTMVDESGEIKLEVDTKNAHVWNELGNVYFNRGAIDDAIVAYSKAIELDRWFAWPYSNLALTYVQKGRFAEAMLLYQRSIELFTEDKDKAISWNRLGNVYRRLSDYDNAIAAYQRADELDPGNTAIYLQSRFSLLGNLQAEQTTV